MTLSLDLSEGYIQEIDSATAFDLGYPHSLLSGVRGKQISAESPAFIVKMCGALDGVQEVKVGGHNLVMEISYHIWSGDHTRTFYTPHR